jgi:light-independent protochlorophyllide reductase subunit B
VQAPQPAPLVVAAPSTPTNPMQAAAAVEAAAVLATAAQRDGAPTASTWAQDAELELKKIPFFVRGKARRNTERYAQERGLATITVETLYDAKAHFSR